MLLVDAFIIALIISSGGFYRLLFFITTGYGLSVSCISIYLLLLFYKNLKYSEIILSLLYIIYGFRLSYYLYQREKSKSYKEHVKSEVDKSNEVGFIPKFFIWVSVALLYICQVSPLIFSIEAKKDDSKMTYIGIFVLIFGLLLEIEADNEKKNMKKINPHKFVSNGLYKIVRCPNYLGEMIIWTGSFLFGINIYNGYFQWIIALLGYIGIIYVMLGGARRIENRQNRMYGKDKEYQEYVKKTPIIIPLIPLYSVQKYEWIRG